jgi:hypothetical protein
MAKCKWCEKSLPGEDIPACNDCLFRSVSSPRTVAEQARLEDINVNIDLSELSNLDKPKSIKGRTPGEVRFNLLTKTIHQPRLTLRQEIPMKIVKIKSNSIRNRILVVGDTLVLSFDENGIAECFESDIPIIVEYSRTRPNRLTIVEEPKVAPPAPAPAPVPVPPTVPAPKVESKVEPKAKVEKVEDSKPNVNKAETPRKPVRKVIPKVPE